MTLATAEQVLDQDFGLLSDLLACHAREQGEKVALIFQDDCLSYRSLDAAMNRIAFALQREGLAPGDNVAIVSDTDNACVMAFLGTLRAGCTPAPLPPSATPRQLLAMIADCRAPLVFTDSDAASALAGTAARIVRLDQLEAWIGR